MKVEIKTVGNITVVRPHADIRVSSILAVKSHLELIEKSAHAGVAVDLAMVSFIDSSGIGIIANFAKRLAVRGIRMCMYNYSSDVKDLLDITGIDQAVKLYDREKDMLNGMRSNDHVRK
jgi:anti-sigma B factor antagonist